MMRCGRGTAFRAVNIWLSMMAPRSFTSVSGRSSPAPAANFIYGTSGVLPGGRSEYIVGCGRDFQVRTVAALLRSMSTAAVKEVPRDDDKVTKEGEEKKNFPNGAEEKKIVSYWGIGPRKLVKEDGTEWKWNCFMPWETHKSDSSIDVTKHHVPVTFMDKMAYWTVKALRWPTDVFFQRRYGCRAMMLETVAAVPGMVGGMLLHCKIQNVPAPAIAIDYWQLPQDATLRDVVVVVRADEAHHRDVNHFASDVHCQGRELKEAPAPIDYH